jgi:hypothetical protein
MVPKVCPYCSERFFPSIYHPEQVICSSIACQRRRRTEYHRKRIAENSAYRADCLESRKHWKERNPGYMKQYRARARNEKSLRSGQEPDIDQLIRLLRDVKNTAAKNNSALRVSRCAIDVFWVARTDSLVETNIPWGTQVIVLQNNLNLNR